MLGLQERFGKDRRLRAAGHRRVDGAPTISGGRARHGCLRAEKVAMRAVERAAKGIGDIEHAITLAAVCFGKACAALPKYVGQTMSKTRFEAFSDGVFAFSITLLVLGFALPTVRVLTNADLARTLITLWPNGLAYALSFMVIGIMWQNHQALFRLVERVDRTTVFWNLLLLGGTAFIPFATSVLGQYPTMPAGAFLYGVALTETSTCYNLVLAHLIRSKAFHASVTPERIAATRSAYRTGWFAYFFAMLLALVLPLASFVAYIAVAVYYLIPRGVDDDIIVDRSPTD